MTLLLTLLFKSLLVFTLAGAVLVALRRASASARHLVCLLTLISLLVLPLFSLTLPGWHLPVLQSQPSLPAQEPTPAQTAVSMQKVPPAPNNGGVGLGTEGAASSAPTGSVLAPPLLGAGGPNFLWPFALIILYTLGVLLAGLRPLLGLWGISRLHRVCVPVSDTPALALAADCAAALRLKRLPQLCRADVCVPMTWGGHRSVVLLPSAFINWPEDRTRAVLLHEMAHVKRRDWTCHRLADFACTLYWFHPLVWLTARRLRAESELACDDIVLSSGVAAADYARHLLDIAQALPSASRPFRHRHRPDLTHRRDNYDDFRQNPKPPHVHPPRPAFRPHSQRRRPAHPRRSAAWRQSTDRSNAIGGRAQRQHPFELSVWAHDYGQPR